ncbi:hypothetical protein RsTz2092_07960 [Deferribacterales bacterium RsTz2092]|nr:hypothetical protein AGMMS49941_10560 [Deferribacterales bacterium]
MQKEYKLSKEELDRVYNKIRLRFLVGRTRPLNGEQPLYVVLAGQPGAGKTNVSERTGDEIKRSGNNFVLADLDNFREFHPNYERAYKEQGRDASKYNHEDAGIWNNRLIKEAMENGYNIITEGTFRNEGSFSLSIQTSPRKGAFLLQAQASTKNAHFKKEKQLKKA